MPVKRALLQDGLVLSWSDENPDIWLEATCQGRTSSLCLNNLNGPIARQAFYNWALQTIERIEEQAHA